MNQETAFRIRVRVGASRPRPQLAAAAAGAAISAAVASDSGALPIVPTIASALPQSAPAAAAESQPRDFSPPEDSAAAPSVPRRGLNLAHRYSVAVFALLFLAVGVAAINVGGDYWSQRVLSSSKPAAAVKIARPTIAGLNLTVPAGELQAKLQTITGQPATLTVGTQTVPVGASTIRSWLQVTPSKNKQQDYIRITAGAIAASLNKLAGRFAAAPVNQVTISEAGVNRVVVAGRNGAELTDPAGLKTQADQIAKTVMNGQGLNFNTPLQTVPFQAVGPSAFTKLLDINLTTKQMYAYQNGQLVQTFAVSAGKPSTPTPTGEFRIWTKLTKQTMVGPGYVQPNVPWVNYFDHSGDAVHGVYWRPASVFGNVNTSHGCVGVPVSQAEWIYNWAPIGTTVITHD